MSKVTKLALVTMLLFGIAGTASAQRPARARAAQHPAAAYKREVPAALLRRTRISEDSALKVASARIRGGKVQALELENENGKLIWSWEFTIEGRPGVFECNVNALDGSVVGVEHELPKTDSTRAHRAEPSTKRP
jgi:uncharacterized membrane protein YkoI